MKNDTGRRGSWIQAVTLLACCLTTSRPSHAEVDWKPDQTRVFAVGVLQWKNPDIWPGMANAQRQRRDAELVQHFKTAGVANDRVVYLHDQQATRDRIQKELKSQLAQTKPNELLIFYFAGHGFRDRKSHEVHLANYDAEDGPTAWSVRSLFDVLEAHYRGSHVLLMADCCYSGGLVDEARTRKSRLGYACLCSSHSHNSSTGRWTFTDTLLAGLRGSPVVDLNNDGEIAIHELGQFSELEMAFVERQKSVYDTSREFPAQWRLSKPAQRRSPRQGERVEVEWNGKWYRGVITSTSADQCRIHYVDYSDSWDEWVGPNRLRPFEPRHLNQGTAIEVRWATDKKWYPAKVLRSWYGLTYIHYEGFTNEWDEWVNFDSIRLPGQGK
jgi:hypothetical protein